ncbi:hypothetical protein [Nocardioides sp.]|uniref:hypothetical protein n=1 Tax=Nocardioides sp. TaxID=35761 RepID=UPI003D0D8D48
MACEHLGLGWIIYAPNHDENFMGRTKPVRLAGPLIGFNLEDAAVIAMAGWAAECHHLDNWNDPYVREGAEHDFIVLDELDERRRDPVTDRAKELVLAEWQRVGEIAADMLERFG